MVFQFKTCLAHLGTAPNNGEFAPQTTVFGLTAELFLEVVNKNCICI